jgi:hypothetical protein
MRPINLMKCSLSPVCPNQGAGGCNQCCRTPDGLDEVSSGERVAQATAPFSDHLIQSLHTLQAVLRKRFTEDIEFVNVFSIPVRAGTKVVLA